MSRSSGNQVGYGVRFDWGPVGAAAVGRDAQVLVIVDVLSFTTATTVAVERGVAVYPAPDEEVAAALADEVGGEVAVGRREVTEGCPWSLSPAALRTARAPSRLVLPSPNGSAMASVARGVVVAACLRNASAVAAWLIRRHMRGDEPVTVVAAGERWPDGSLRPASEDLLGAGAVLAALAERDGGIESPEAACARAAYEGMQSVPDAVRRSASGVELADAGFGEDVEIAAEINATNVVPVLIDGAFRPAED